MKLMVKAISSCPSGNSIPISSNRCSALSRVKGLVNRSAQFSEPGTLLKLMPRSLTCCIHRYDVWMWRVRPSPFLLMMPRAALASLMTLPLA